MYDYREGSKINRNLASPSNSIPRFFDDIVNSINILDLFELISVMVKCNKRKSNFY